MDMLASAIWGTENRTVSFHMYDTSQ